MKAIQSIFQNYPGLTEQGHRMQERYGTISELYSPSPLFFSGQLIEGSPGQFFAEENDGINPAASSSITLKN
jgi:hypothetical protein